MPVLILRADPRIQAARNPWCYRGQIRPDFADELAPGQESVWYYPRPPLTEDVVAVLRVKHGD